MRTGDPHRWRLGGWRGRGEPRTGWWEGSDGRSYPPEAARHPAARREPAAPRPTPPRRPVVAGPLWLVALVPVAGLAVVVIGDLVDTTPPARVATFGPEVPDDPGPATEDRPAGRVSAASVAASVHSQAVEAAVAPGGGSVARPRTPADPADPADAADPADDAAAAGAEDRGEAASAGSPAPPAVPAPPAAPAVTASPTTTAPAATPRSRDDCRHGGWRHLVDDQGRPFDNQGRCVSYVNA